MSPITPDRQPYDQTPWGALQAAREGDTAKLCASLEELTESLLLIGELLDPSDECVPPLTFEDEEGETSERLAQRRWKRPLDQGPMFAETKRLSQEAWDHLMAAEKENTWMGTFSDVSEAVQLRLAAPFGWYLRTVAQLLMELQDNLESSSNSESQRLLKFQRRRRGRPSDEGEVLNREAAIAKEVESEKRRLGKQEAAVRAVGEKYGRSRATIMRLLQSHKMRK